MIKMDTIRTLIVNNLSWEDIENPFLYNPENDNSAAGVVFKSKINPTIFEIMNLTFNIESQSKKRLLPNNDPIYPLEKK